MFIKRLLSIAFFLLFTLTTFALKVGDKATELNVNNWIKNGPIKIEDGLGKKVYIIEFWATWCPPCRTSIPHLSDLQKKYKDNDLIVVGISSESKRKIKKFVKKQSNMNYSVASDSNRNVYNSYMKEYSGIPTAFLINKKGLIVWVGHPMSLNNNTIEKLIKEEGTPVKEEVTPTESTIKLNKKLESINKKIKLNKNNAKAYLYKLWITYSMNNTAKWLETFQKLDKNNTLKKAKVLAPFYKVKKIIANIKQDKTTIAIEELNKALSIKKGGYQRFILRSIIYYNYSQTQKGEKNLFDDEIKQKLSSMIEIESKTKNLFYKIYLLNLKSYLQAGCGEYEKAIATEQEALEIATELENKHPKKDFYIELVNKNMGIYKKKLKNDQ